jgi:hypothetical protein
MRFPRIAFPLLVWSVLLVALRAEGQSPNGNINGLVLDPTSRVIAGAEIIAVNDVTGVQFTGKTNGDGVYVLPNLPPGPYRLQVSKVGFKTIIKPDVILNVQDALSINFTLPIGALLETVTVQGGVPLLNTESAAVSTVVDRQFVENMPLNGRSFQTLITLTPGVILTPTSYGEQGQFSVNGQRPDTNYFMIDGASANVGVAGGNGLSQSAGGAIPGFSAQGGTNSLVSVDAMQEFRIQTSSFSPEFGSTPGGQVSIVTRSGTNQFHGTLFDYFRNDILDANSWFGDEQRQPKPEDRQNDFGGVFGGPIVRNRLFFFFSYEGLRLRQPLTSETIVPDASSRQAAPAAIQPFLNAFPAQNGSELGSGVASFNASYSNPSSLDAYSLRLDHVVNSRFAFFGRYNHSPSHTASRSQGDLGSSLIQDFSINTFTLGLTATPATNISNEVRLNYSNAEVASSNKADNFGGAVPPPDSVLFPTGVSSTRGEFLFDVLGMGAFVVGKNQTNEQRQVDLVDGLSVSAGRHQLKFGIDYRWLAPFSSPVAYEQEAVFLGITGPGGVLSGLAPVVLVNASQGNALLSRNLSLYAQDKWTIAPRLTMTYGLRWDLNPALKGKNLENAPFTVVGLDHPATMTLAPRGTALYPTTYRNLAPRFGAAYQLRQNQNWGTVLRAGIGIFYDLGTGSLGQVTSGFPYIASNPFYGVAFPLSPEQALPPNFSLQPPVSAPLFVASPNLKLPRTYQWNVAIEQSMGLGQSLSLTYVGAIGRDLLRPYVLSNPSADFSLVSVTTNGGRSNYQAMQIKYQRRLASGVQALGYYAFSHSIDNASSDSAFYTPTIIANPNIDRGNSDFDVRHSITGALTYDLPDPFKKRMGSAILRNWSLDNFLTARSALPVDIVATTSVIDGVQFNARPNVVSGIPLYVYGSQYPGGKILNNTPGEGGAGCLGPFCAPPVGQQGDLGRNVLRGFSVWQDDFTIRRQIHVTDRVGLQFRAEFFNILNHPNFGPPTNLLTSALFGLSTQTLANSLGGGGISGGFNPLYQLGGPRSIQFALKLQF